MLKRKYLILGHPRSGTKYMAHLFQANGFDVQHESMGKDGTSNWQFAVNAEKYPYTYDNYKKQDVEFEITIHVIRKPIDAINSIAFTEGGSEPFRLRYVNMIGNSFEKAITSYYKWNCGIIKSQNPTLTIALDQAQEKLGFKKNTNVYNDRFHRNITEENLRMICEKDIWKQYLSICEFYKSL